MKSLDKNKPKELEGKGIKVGEAEGWDFFFGSKKQCCPGDDYSDIYNQAISDVLNIMEEK